MKIKNNFTGEIRQIFHKKNENHEYIFTRKTFLRKYLCLQKVNVFNIWLGPHVG